MDAVVLKAKWAGFDPRDGLNFLHDLVDGDLRRRARQGVAATEASLGTEEAGTSKYLKDLGQVGRGHLSGLSDLLRGLWFTIVGSEMDHGPKRIFRGVTEHPKVSGVVLYPGVTRAKDELVGSEELNPRNTMP